MDKIVIKNNAIRFSTGDIFMGMSFAEAEKILKSEIYVAEKLEQKGIGIIIVKGKEFYGLKGTVTIYFQKGVVKKISISPEWNLYNLYDENGNRLQIDAAVKMVANMSENGLRTELGSPTEESKYGNSVFEVDNLNVITSLARSEDDYSVVIQ